MERDYDVVETNEAYLDVTRKGDHFVQKWFNLSPLATIKPNEVNVKIYYSGIDYKDFLHASGKCRDYIEDL